MTEKESEDTLEKIGKEYARILMIVDNTLANLRHTNATNSELAAVILTRIAQHNFIWENIGE